MKGVERERTRKKASGVLLRREQCIRNISIRRKREKQVKRRRLLFEWNCKKRNAKNNGFPSRSRSEHIESRTARYLEREFTSVYRIERSEIYRVAPQRDLLRILWRLRRSIYCARRGIAQFDMCFALDMPREHGSICRLRDKSQRKGCFSLSRARRRRIR